MDECKAKHEKVSMIFGEQAALGKSEIQGDDQFTSGNFNRQTTPSTAADLDSVGPFSRQTTLETSDSFSRQTTPEDDFNSKEAIPISSGNLCMSHGSEKEEVVLTPRVTPRVEVNNGVLWALRWPISLLGSAFARFYANPCLSRKDDAVETPRDAKLKEAKEEFDPPFEKEVSFTGTLSRVTTGLFTHLPTLGFMETKPQLPVVTGKRHLVLNFDVNATIIMSDKIQNIAETDVANSVLANVSWGTMVDDKWVLIEEAPSVRRPTMQNGQEVLSYFEFIEKSIPGSSNKKVRKDKVKRFTLSGAPGEKMAPQAKELVEKLQMPDGKGAVFIIPAFFELLVHLKRTGRSFTIVFRTFGEDLKDIVEELNAFCVGQHPLAPPDVRLDGSDGGPDYRVQLEDISKWGTFYRDGDSMSIVMGTWWQPEKEKVPSLACYEGMPGITIETGSLHEIGKKFRKMCKNPGTLAMRDYFLYWKKSGNCSEGGKPLFYKCSRQSGEHEVFFDDNIRFTDAYIVQPVNMAEPTKKPWTTPLLRTHLCRAEPFESIPNSDYFVKELARLEDAYEKKLGALEHLSEFIRYAALLMKAEHARHSGFRHRKSVEELKDSSYDPWQQLRLTDRHISSASCLHDETDRA